jgi:hypothetical protein
MMLITILAVWLALILFFVVLCRMAAIQDGRGEAFAEGAYNPPAVHRRVAPGLTVWEDPRDLELALRDLRPRVPVAR